MKTFVLIIFLCAVCRTVTALVKKENRTFGQYAVIITTAIAYVWLVINLR